jgi:hypothetical protein
MALQARIATASKHSAAIRVTPPEARLCAVQSRPRSRRKAACPASPLTQTGEKERGICWSQKYFLICLSGQEG